MSGTLIGRLSVLPKVGYTDDEMGELRRVFDGSAQGGVLPVGDAQACLRALHYAYSEEMVGQILSDQTKGTGRAQLDFNDFVAFIDVIGAIDSYVVEHVNDLLQGLPEDALQEAYIATGATGPDDLVHHLTQLVTLRANDDFNFSKVYRLLGYEDADANPAATSPPPAPAPDRSQHHLKAPVPDDAPGPKASEPTSPPQNLSVRFGPGEFRLPALAIPGDDNGAPVPPRTLETQTDPRRHTTTNGEEPEPSPKANASPPPSVSRARTMTMEHVDAQRVGEPADRPPAEDARPRRSLSPDHPLDRVAPGRALVVADSSGAPDAFDDDDLDYIRGAFDAFVAMNDHNGAGGVAVRDLGTALRAVGLDPSDEQINDLFAKADIDRNGTLDVHEFALYYRQVSSAELARGLPLHRVQAAFARADPDGDGEIARADFAHVLRQQFPNLSGTRIDQLVGIADVNGDGTIDFEEFMAFLSRNDDASRALARKLFRAHLPTPVEHLAAFSKMPSSFRPSALAPFDGDPGSYLGTRVAPRLASAPGEFGLSFANVHVDRTTGVLAPIASAVCLQIEVIGAEGIPAPVMHRDRIQARRLRLALLDGDRPVSNQYVVRARWDPDEEDRWKFDIPDGDALHHVLVKTAYPQPTLLAELTVMVEGEQSSAVTEMTCGFAVLELTGEMLAKKVVESVAVAGGTFRARAPIHDDEILARRAGWRRVSSMFKGKPAPILKMQIGPAPPRKKLKPASWRWLPNDVIVPAHAVNALHAFMDLAADATVRCAQPVPAAAAHQRQEVPLRLFVDRILRDTDALSSLATRWDQVFKALARADKRDRIRVRSEFAKCIVQMWPVLSSLTLPDLVVGQTELERMSLMKHCAGDAVLNQLASDGCGKRLTTTTATTPTVSTSLVYRPFHTDELVFAYDRYTPDVNVFAVLERKKRINAGESPTDVENIAELANVALESPRHAMQRSRSERNVSFQ